MSRQRSETAQQIADLLRSARSSLGLSLAFLSRMDGVTQHLEVVEFDGPDLVSDGFTQRQETSLCQAIMDGELPPVIRNVEDFPGTMTLPAVQVSGIRSFVSVPVTLSDGSVYGSFCAAGFAPDDDLAERDRALMEVLAAAAAMIIEPDVRKRRRSAGIAERLGPLIDGGGPVVLLQPVVDLTTGERTGAEALSRFPQQWNQPPDLVFADAELIGCRERLEMQALQRAAAHLPYVSGYVAMNVSPATLATTACRELLGAMPLDRVLLELSEHDPIDDYDALRAMLAPLRARGMRLAIDDVGAGFSSLRHIVVTAPDVIKLDRSLVAGVADDTVLTALTRAMVDLAGAIGAQVVAEGIETAADAAALAGLGVDHGQGWHFDRATTPDALRDTYSLLPAAGALVAHR
ncbi:sensor domain-containing phosphodiesterase [Actinoplanes sp. URMC 104]|uniref:sensor domain-containing phosphodiesterase n=1 Tax=Actinoplanes sp. URMC 104 TaxID=3423409 RepID=UPI003F19E7E9